MCASVRVFLFSSLTYKCAQVACFGPCALCFSRTLLCTLCLINPSPNTFNASQNVCFKLQNLRRYPHRDLSTRAMRSVPQTVISTLLLTKPNTMHTYNSAPQAVCFVGPRRNSGSSGRRELLYSMHTFVTFIPHTHTHTIQTGFPHWSWFRSTLRLSLPPPGTGGRHGQGFFAPSCAGGH